MDSWKSVALFKKNRLNGNNIFHDIVSEGSEGSLILLQQLEKGFKPNSSRLREWNQEGETCVTLAARLKKQQRAIEALEILLRLGADINSRNQFTGNTVLHDAICKNKYKLAKWLCLRPDVDLTVQNNGQYTPYELAVQLQSPKLRDLLNAAEMLQKSRRRAQV